jgi:phytoene synthase
MPTPSPEPGFASPADLAACREMLRVGSRTFFAASLLLPQAVRGPACALYAFCRLADDAVDLEAGRLGALARLHERLDLAYRGRPARTPVDRAFADVVARFAIPRTLPEALFQGFAWDALGRRYDDLSDLRAYAVRVAGTVGVMMALLMGVRSTGLLARACDLGVAMQLTNIARDVGEDARAGRLYLPRDWLREAGIEPEAFLARPVFSAELGAVIQRLLRAADRLYERGAAGIAGLPPACRPGIRAARLLYAEIGRELERRGLDSVSQRVVVSATRKVRLLGSAALGQVPAAPGPWPVLAEARFLVDAVAAAPLPAHFEMGAAVPWWDLDSRLGWVIELFERLERRERLATLPLARGEGWP